MSYAKRGHYTNRQLAGFIIHDLIADIRFSARKIAAGMNATEETPYCESLKVQLAEIFRNRHSVAFDRYGRPRLESFRSKGGTQT